MLLSQGEELIAHILRGAVDDAGFPCDCARPFFIAPFLVAFCTVETRDRAVEVEILAGPPQGGRCRQSLGLLGGIRRHSTHGDNGEARLLADPVPVGAHPSRRR